MNVKDEDEKNEPIRQKQCDECGKKRFILSDYRDPHSIPFSCTSFEVDFSKIKGTNNILNAIFALRNEINDDDKEKEESKEELKKKQKDLEVLVDYLHSLPEESIETRKLKIKQDNERTKNIIKFKSPFYANALSLSSSFQLKTKEEKKEEKKEKRKEKDEMKKKKNSGLQVKRVKFLENKK